MTQAKNSLTSLVALIPGKIIYGWRSRLLDWRPDPKGLGASRSFAVKRGNSETVGGQEFPYKVNCLIF